MVSYDEWGNEKPTWPKSRIIRVTAWTIVLLGAIGGAAYGIYKATHKDKHGGGGGGGPGYDPVPITTSNYTFPTALNLTLSFLAAQKSGKLPANNPISWRKDSCLEDGSDVSVDLAGGLFDAGDHIKFGLPMAFTSTIMAWSILEYGPQMHAENLVSEAADIVKWVSDYLVKAHVSADEFYFQVGDPNIDHKCWQRAEDVDAAARPSYKVDAANPGSDVAGEAAAALAAASIVFRKTSPYKNTTYADNLLLHARDLFDFAQANPGKYSDSFPNVVAFYNSTGYEDELLWAAAWLYEATGDEEYMQFVTGDLGKNSAGWGEAPMWLSWDDKRPGVQVLLSRTHLLKPPSNRVFSTSLGTYKSTADQLMCALIPNSPTSTKRRTDGGMIWILEWSASIQAVNAAFLALVYSDYLLAAQAKLTCDGHTYAPDQLRHFAYTQAHYLLGSNPRKMSYLVGYGTSYPQYLHHRGASIPEDGKAYDCNSGFVWLDNASPNPNVARGGLVGGPALNDTFSDDRRNTQQNEAATYNSATLAGLVAGLSYLNDEGVPLSYLS